MIHSRLLFIAFNFVCFAMVAQESQPVEQDTTVYERPDEFASPEGGIQVFYQAIAMTIQYPLEARRKKIVGRVFVGFIVETDGTLSHVKTIRGIGFGCDEAAEEAVKASPKWIQARKAGQPVRSRQVLPVSFNLAKK